MKLRYERGALTDLDEIFAYVAQNDRSAAARLVEEIEKTASLIAATPEIGGTTRRPPLRRFRSGHYLLVYEITKREVVIYYIRHDGRRRAWDGE
jgi:toxin ParE1/3/4